MNRRFQLVAIGVCSYLAWCSSTPCVEAAIVDLTMPGSSGVIRGAIFEQFSSRSSPLGLVEPFVQQRPLDSQTISRAYNTTADNVFDNGPSNAWNRSIALSEVRLVTREGVPYRQFLLEVDENIGGGDEFISVDEVQILVGGASNSDTELFSLSFPPRLAVGGTLVYQMDSAFDNSAVALNAALKAGNGAGDMLMLVPDAAFDGLPDTAVVTLYSELGSLGVDPPGFVGNFGVSGGFEEWSAPIPEPSTLLLGALAAAVTMAVGRRY